MKQLQFPRHVILKIVFSCCAMCTSSIILNALWSCSFSNFRFVLQVMQFVEAQEFNMFSRIVFDTAPTVSTI